MRIRFSDSHDLNFSAVPRLVQESVHVSMNQSNNAHAQRRRSWRSRKRRQGEQQRNECERRNSEHDSSTIQSDMVNPPAFLEMENLLTARPVRSDINQLVNAAKYFIEN